MKKTLLTVLLSMICFVAFGQVGIGSKVPEGSIIDGSATTDPKGALHLQGQHYISDTIVRSLGLVLPSADSEEDIQDAVGGTIIFNKTDSCIKVMGEAAWQDCLVDKSSLDDFFDFDVYGGLNVPVKKVSAGYFYSLVIGLKDDAVYMTGLNDIGRGGIVGSVDVQNFNMVLAKKTVDVSAGYTHSLAATETGEVWAWGANDYGKLGTGDAVVYYLPKQIQLPYDTIKAVRVEAGFFNSLILGDNKRVYATGGGIYAGLDGTTVFNTTYRAIPLNIPDDPDIKDISLAQFSAAALTTDGKVYTWGNNNVYGRLGRVSTPGVNMQNSTPTQILFPDDELISFVAMGNEHGLAISADGKKLFAWGQLNGVGLGNAVADHQPQPIDITEAAFEGTDFEVGVDTITYATLTHLPGPGNASIVITSKGMYGAGTLDYAQRMGLGFFDYSIDLKYSPVYYGDRASKGFKKLYTQAIYPGTKFTQVSMGTAHSLYATEVGEDGEGGFGYGSGIPYYYCLFGKGSSNLGPAFPVLLKQ